MRASALLFVLFFIWPAALVDDSGPPMADSSLLAAIRLVDAGTWTLSDESDPKLVFQTLAHDISAKDGRVYSGVGPGATVVAVPLYAMLGGALDDASERIVTNRRITRYYRANARALGQPAATHFSALYLMQILATVLIIAPLFASLWVRLFRVLGDAGCASGPALCVCLAGAFGTMALYYGSMYSRQALAYGLAWHAVLWLVGPVAPDRWRCIGVGLLFGAAMAIEYPCALLVGVVLLFQSRRLGLVQWLWIALPLGGALALLAVYHHALFGAYLTTPYHHRFWYTPPVLAERGIALELFQPASTLGLNTPSLSVMLQLCFGPFKGLFVYSPILLLGLVGHAVGLRSGRHIRLHRMSLAVFGLYLAYNSSIGTHVPEHAHHFWGGLSTLWGPRYLFAVLPLLAWGLVRLDWQRPWVRWSCLVLLAISCANNLLGAMYSHIMMSTFAFGEELQQPLGFAWSLLLERGPRITLLDVQGVSAGWQAAIVVGLLVASGEIVRRVLGAPSRPVPAR